MKKRSVLLIIGCTVCAFWLMNCTSGKKNKKMKMLTATNQTIKSKFPVQPDESIDFEKVKEHFQKYPERWNAAFKFLIESDLKSLPIGRIDLNEDVYAAVSEYETKNPEDAKYESHQKYIDLQYVISGKEIIGLTNESEIKVISPYDENKDIAFYDFEGGKMLSATPDSYFIFFPHDKHRPCIKTEGADNVRKLVVKIKYN